MIVGSPNLNQPIAEPKLVDLFDARERSTLLNLNCHHIGTIQAFDPTKQTATVTINYTKTSYTKIPNNQTGVYTPQQSSYPLLLDCPVICLGGGKTSLTFPIQAGDECLVLFNDRDIDNWFSNSQVTPVATGRLHSFSDGLILVGVRSLANVLTDYDMTRASLKHGEAEVSVGLEFLRLQNEVISLKTLLEKLFGNLINVLYTAGNVVQVPGNTIFDAGSILSLTDMLLPNSPTPVTPSPLLSVNNQIEQLLDGSV